MPPRPFPLSLNIGTDICHTARFEKYFIHHPTGENSRLFRLFDKFLLPSEQELFWKRFPLNARVNFERVRGHARKEVEEEDVGSAKGKEEVGEVIEDTKKRIKGPAGWDEERRKACVNFVGGRWAAKEAVIKAYAPTRRLLLRDIEIRRDSSIREPYGIVLDIPPSSGRGASSAKSIYTDHLQQTSSQPSTLPTESHQQPPSILSDSGILDLSAVQNALAPASPSTSSPIRRIPQADSKVQQAAGKEMKRKTDDAKETMELLDAEGQVVKLSISHDGEYCVATALAAV